MEIAAALVGAVATAAATAAASKLTTTLKANRSCGATEEADVESIKAEVRCINALIRDSYAAKVLLALHIELIAQLRLLACEIEDCVDLFDAGETGDFTNEIGLLKTKSVETRKRIKDYLLMEQGFVAHTPNEAVETREQILSYLEIALRIVGGTAQGAADVSRDLQVLLDDPRYQDWLAQNLNSLLYLCLFPPNHHVRTEPLMRWLAEGLVQDQEIAANNLLFFIDKSLIRSIQTSNNGAVETCQPTIKMHACISENSKSQNFLLVCDGNTSKTELAEARRLAVHPSPNVQLDWPKYLPRLRTLAVFPGDKAGPKTTNSYEDVLDFSRYKVLRVLDLKECAHLTKKGLDNILDDIILKHRQVLMKYLSINLGSNKGISDKIENLNRLETLDLSGSDDILTVFKEVLLLPKLKHLLGKFEFSRSETMSIKPDSVLKEFLSKKSVLETLDGFVTGTRYGFPDLMSFMRCLRKVKIWCKSNASKKKLGLLSSAITEFVHRGTDELQRVRSLSIDFAECSTEFVNTKIKAVPAVGILGSLELRGKLSQFPPFVAGLSAIDELLLCSTGLSWEVILAGLSNVWGLKYLKLVEDELGPIDILSDHLKSIKRICVVCMPRPDITIQADALPHLVSLHILCQKLDVIPGTRGIQITHMTKLKEVVLHPRIADGIKDEWKKAVDGHANKPVLLPIQVP